MQSMLSDGTEATAVHLSLPTAYAGCAAVGGNVWLLGQGATHITVRNAKSGEVVSKVDTLDEGVAIAAVGGKIWVSTARQKIFVFGSDSTLLGVLQASGIPAVTSFFPISDSLVATCGDGKDIALWDTTKFTVERTLFGRNAGERVTGVVAANPSHTSLFASSTTAIRLWSIDGACLAEQQEGATSIASVEGEGDQASLWAAQSGWITVFSVGKTTRTTTFTRERTLPCAGVKQLSRSTPDHIVALDAEGLVTIWSIQTFTPARTFKVTGTIGSPANAFNCLAVQTSHINVWTIGSGKAMIWQDEHTEHLTPGAMSAVKDLQADEIEFLRRKLKFLESSGTLYRQKIGMLFREGSQTQARLTSSHITQFNDADRDFSKCLEEWDTQHKANEPLPNPTDLVPGDEGRSADFTEYWKRKFNDTNSELQQLKTEYESVVELLHSQQQSPHEVEIKRAHHICSLIKEKNELKERERQLVEDVARLRQRLREYGTPLGAHLGPREDVDAIKQDNEDLRGELMRLRMQCERDSAAIADNANVAKQNQILKSRVKKLRADLDASQMELSNNTTAMQKDVETMLETITQLQDELERRKTDVLDAEKARADAELVSLQHTSAVERLTKNTDMLRQELQQREAVEKSTQAEIRQELSMLCQSLDDRDKKILELQNAFNGASVQVRDQTAHARQCELRAEAKEQELAMLREQLQQFEGIVNDRKNYARTVSELQGRMEMVVEELRRSFTPVQFQENISNLEDRVANLFSLESQLRQKDDIIATRDDEIQRLREHAQRMEERVKQVSSVFMHLPKSVEEVELLMVEVDEYRRRLGLDPETQEMVQIRLLELQAKRRAGEEVPSLLNLGDLGVDTTGKSAEELDKLRVLSDTMMQVVNSIGRDDKTGLVGTPAASKSAA